MGLFFSVVPGGRGGGRIADLAAPVEAVETRSTTVSIADVF